MQLDIFDSKLEEFLPFSDDLKMEIESVLGKKLPKSYIELMRHQNGGYLRKSAFLTKVKNCSAEGYIPVNLIAGLHSDPSNVYGVLMTTFMIAEWGLPKHLVLFCGDGHTWVALDYRENRTEPEVTYFDVEMGQEIKLASSFEEFVNKLIVEPET